MQRRTLSLQRRDIGVVEVGYHPQSLGIADDEHVDHARNPCCKTRSLQSVRMAILQLPRQGAEEAVKKLLESLNDIQQPLQGGFLFPRPTKGLDGVHQASRTS